MIFTTRSLTTLVAASVLAMLNACSNMNMASAPKAEPVISAARAAEIVASADRSTADRTTDIRRRPQLVIPFVNAQPGMSVLDLAAGGGYSTELMARSVGATGKVYAQNAPRPPAATPPAPPVPPAAPAAAATTPATPPAGGPPPGPPGGALAARLKTDALKNTTLLTRAFETPLPDELAKNSMDRVTIFYSYHDLGFMPVDRAAMNKAVFEALKPGGYYVVADHSGRDGTGISEARSLHRIEEAFLRKEVEAAGFKLVDAGQFLRNPTDPRNIPVLSPDQLKDEFILKFVKP